MNFKECPICESMDTDRQAIMSASGDLIDMVRTCDNCITQFTVTFSAGEKSVDVTEADR